MSDTPQYEKIVMQKCDFKPSAIKRSWIPEWAWAFSVRVFGNLMLRQPLRWIYTVKAER